MYLMMLSMVMVLACGEDGEIPAYVELTSYSLSTLPGEGSASHKITDAWLFVEGRSIGAYQLPAEIPILGDGPTKLDIFPVIKENGVQAFSIMYPFYTKMDTVFDLEVAESRRLELSTTYSKDVNFAIIEDFEGSHFFTQEIDGNDGTKIEIDRTDVFEGTSSGKIVLTQQDSIIEAGWHQFFFPGRGGTVFIELDYKCNIPFIVGLRGSKDGTFIKLYENFINTKDTWNKIYFNVSELIEPEVFDQYHPVIVGVRPDNLEEDEAVIHVDNFKLIRLE